LKDEETEGKKLSREVTQKSGDGRVEAARIAAAAWQVNHDYVSSAKWIGKQGGEAIACGKVMTALFCATAAMTAGYAASQKDKCPYLSTL
jgi:hypothetical protein